ncbi:MAG TPA: PAS domain S-box protein, partial [Bacteroidetes bacterium]|nr:PAS domain S-box protein [Bacteroidota bacterium]HEX04960.1 PAS domain S-box protein [Bacteroidota bacterium]
LELALSSWESGERKFIAAISRDITERKQIEESLRESADSLKVAQRIANMGSWSWDIETDTVTMSDNACSMYGISPGEFGEDYKSTISFIHPDDRAMVRNKFSAILKNKQPAVFEYRIVTKAGEEKIVRSHQQPVPDDDGNIIRLVGTMQDITERKQAEASVRESEIRYRTLFETASDAIFLMTGEMFIDCNKMTLDMFGCKREEIVGQSPIDFSPPLQPDGKKSSEEAMKRISATLNGNPQFFEWQHCKLDGTVFDAEVSLNLVELASDTFIQAIVRDVTERKRAEDAIRESELRFRSVIEQSNDALYILADGRFELINRRFTELTGITVEDSVDPDFDFMETLTPESKTLVQKRSEMWDRGEEPPGVYEFSLIHKDGNIHHVQASVTEIDYRDSKAILGILRDISEQKSLEDQLRQAQKIESIGHLAGGIAHDFNNLLTPIIGNTELAMMQMEPSNPLYEDLHEINETALRASELTRQLLAFSRKQVLDVKTVSLNKLIENFRKILRRTIREDIKISMKYGMSIGNIRVDVSQIEQILMNLMVNAQDAMPDGGVITVSTEPAFLDRDYAESHPGVTVGQYILLSISDTGEGIPEDIVQNIFDPFFTTKDVGKGTGLGLSTVYGIIKQHGGNIWVDSVPDKGTTFKLYFPLVEDESIEPSDSDHESNAHLGTGVVLVVEDQADVRLIATRILKACGYTVHAASNGYEAITKIREDHLSIDLLLTDVIMPNMNGHELYTLLSESDPNMKAIYMSGYTQDIISQKGILEKGIDFLQKPLTVDALASKVKEVLARDNNR